MLSIINKFISYIDNYNHNNDNINIKINYLEKKEYLTRICKEYKKAEGRKANKEIRSFFSKSEGITFYCDEDNSARIYIKKSYHIRKDNQYKNKIIYHEISHALNRIRFSEVDAVSDTIFDGLCFIDEFLAYYDCNYCIMKEMSYSEEKEANVINNTLNKIIKFGLTLHTIAAAAGCICAFSGLDKTLIDSKFISIYDDIVAFCNQIDYLITKEKITNEDCENVEFLKEELFNILY